MVQWVYMSLERQLWQWREQQAQMEGIEAFKIFSKATLDAIVSQKPTTKEELLQIKGIKERKYQKYGRAILALVTQDEQLLENTSVEIDYSTQPLEPLTISQFLDGLNVGLSGMAARVQGEVTSVDERERVVYFNLKDATDSSTLSCLIFRYAYQVSGIRLRIGDEVIIEGAPEIYKPNGRLSFKAGLIEALGEGALKKAYDELFQKLSLEGVFSQDQKKALPEYPERIALITSQDGAAIGDFKMNLGPCGFQIGFYPTAVEGKKAVFEMLEAVRYFRQHQDEYDVLVIVRGGGSLESLQAFNNETLVREIAGFPLPTLLGVGHEKDITLAALASSRMVSTPTATAQALSLPWQEARRTFSALEKNLPTIFRIHLERAANIIKQNQDFLWGELGRIQSFVRRIESQFGGIVVRLEEGLRMQKRALIEQKKALLQGMEIALKEQKKRASWFEEVLKNYHPQRALRLGYSLIRNHGTVVKSTKGLKKDDILTVELFEGSLETIIKKITH